MTADPRIVEGLAAQAELLGRLEAGGARRIGWKAGFGAPSALTMMELDGPLVGFLTDRTVLPAQDGAATAPLTGWTRPMAEAEVAIILAADLGPEAGPDELRAAVGAVAPAIELADLDIAPSPDAVAAILAGDIFHRHVLVGPTHPTAGGWDGAALRATVHHVAADGRATDTEVPDVEAVAGTAVDVLASCARGAALVGPGLRRGDVVILGSMVPPVAVAPGDRFALSLTGWSTITVGLTD